LSDDAIKNMKTKSYAVLALVALAVIAAMPAHFAFAQESVPTVKVTGDASVKADPDQAVMIINAQTMPSQIATALDEQRSKTNGIVSELRTTLGSDEKTSITVGQMSLNPMYGGTPSYSGISTFSIYSSTAIETDIESFSDIVRKLTEAGFGFEGVYASHLMYAGSGYPMVASEQSADGQVPEAKKDSNKMTLNVSINTKPGKLDAVLTEYDEKYKKLVSILEEAGIAADQIKPANVNVNPYYYGPTQTSTYQTYSQIIVKTDARNIEKVSSVAQKQGAFVENTFLSVSDESLEKLRDRLYSQAFDTAKLRAESMAKLAGMKVGPVKNIESTTSIVNPYNGYQSYKGLYVIPPYYYQSMSGEIAASIIVEFEMVK